MTTTLIDVDPRELVVESNVRTNLGDLAPLVASIKERGVLVPLIVRPENGHYVLVAGGRRRAAAIKAKMQTVPVVVSDLDSSQGFLEAQMIENLARVDLSAADEAAGFQQLAAFGLSDATIASLTSKPKERVEAGRVVAESETAHTVAKKYDLTLEQAAMIAEVEDDRDAVKLLTVTAVENPEDFDHEAARIRQDRARARKLEDLRAKAAEDGLALVESMPPHPSKLDELVDDDGHTLTEAKHRKCPGHAGYLVHQGWQDPRIIFVCTDSKANGHKFRYASTSTSGSSAPVDEEASEKRREVIAGNKAWRAAETVRLKFVSELLARKTPPKGTLRFVVEEIVQDPEGLGRGRDELIAQLAGLETKSNRFGRHVLLDEAQRIPDGRLPMMLLAQIAADREAVMGVHTWRGDGTSSTRSTAAGRWLTFLASCGYSLSDVEKRVR